MTRSASPPRRDLKRAATARRINACAQELALAHGLDGFHMDDLAEAAGVSRRTLFNYFAGKDAAVLGDAEAFDDALVATFASGGPNGNLVEDVSAIVLSFLGVQDLQPEEVARYRLLLAREPKLVALAQRRFEEKADQVFRLIERREGEEFDQLRARVVIHVMGSLFDLTLTSFLEQPDRPLTELFIETVVAARTAFA